MRVTGSRAYSRPAPAPKMPPGLTELLEGLTKDVLKNNPTNVYEFCADHMKKLLEIRDGPSKTLSLDQKIIKAQEKVKKRAEQRWRRYKEELAMENTSTVDNKDKISTDENKQLVNANLMQTLLKPVHHESALIQASEVEISCEPDSHVIPPLKTEKVLDDNDDDVVLVHDNAPLLEDNHSSHSPISEDKSKEGESEKEMELVEVNESQKGNNEREKTENLYEKEVLCEVSDSNKANITSEKETSNITSNSPSSESEKDTTIDKPIEFVTDSKNKETSNITPNLPSLEIIKDTAINKPEELVIDSENEIETCKITANSPSLEIINDTEIDKPEDLRTDSKNELQNEFSMGSETTEQVEDNVVVDSGIEKTETVLNSPSLELKNDNTINNELETSENVTQDELRITEQAENHDSNLFVKKNEIISNCSDETERANIPCEHDEIKMDCKNESQDDFGVSTEQIENHNHTESKDMISEEHKDISANENTGPCKVDEDLDKEKVLVSSDNQKDSNENDSKIIAKEDHDEIKLISNLEPREQYKNATDLEKVVNDAIENINRKDSNAADFINQNHIFNEDESDGSDGSNVTDTHIKSIINIDETKQKNDGQSTSANDVITILKEAEIDNLLFTNENPENLEENKRPIRSIQEPTTSGNDNITHEKNAQLSNKCDELDNGNIGNTTEKNPESFSESISQNDNTTAMDLETAAVTIQKVFRTFLFKSRASTFDDTENEDNILLDEDENKDDRPFLATNLNKERRTLGISRMDTVLQTVNEEKSLSLSTDDSSLSSAATIIQAHVRGFLVRNKFNSGKTASSSSLVNSSGLSGTSTEGEIDPNKSKTILNIHIVPEGGNYLSRDESMITSMDLSLDGSPPSSVNLHPLGYNTSERRKQLKREDAVQSVSPPSNNSGKLSEDSVKELVLNENALNMNQDEKTTIASLGQDDSHQETEIGSLETTPTNSLTIETVVENKTSNTEMPSSPETVTDSPEINKRSLKKQSSDEMDVITPYKENDSSGVNTQKLLHSGEFHDAVLPTKVSRSDTPVVSEFKNVLVYFLLWNNS